MEHHRKALVVQWQNSRLPRGRPGFDSRPVQGVENFCPKLSLFVVVVVFVFTNLPSHSSFTCSFIFNCKQNLFVLNLLVYISLNLLSYQGVFVFFQQCFVLRHRLNVPARGFLASETMIILCPCSEHFNFVKTKRNDCRHEIHRYVQRCFSNEHKFQNFFYISNLQDLYQLMLQTSERISVEENGR